MDTVTNSRVPGWSGNCISQSDTVLNRPIDGHANEQENLTVCHSKSERGLDRDLGFEREGRDWKNVVD